MLTANTPAPKTRAEAWAAFEAAIIQKLGRETTKRLPAHHLKFNRGEILMNCIDGGTMRINIMVKHQRWNINPKVVRIASHYPELRARQQREIVNNRAPSWERIMNFAPVHVKGNNITGGGLAALPLTHIVDGKRAVVEVIDGELNLMPIDESATYFVAMTTKVSHLAYEGQFYDVVAVVAKNYDDIQKFEEANIGFFKTM